MPAITGTIRAGNEEPMQNRQKNRPLHVELELSVRQKPTDDLADAQFLPEPLTDQGWSDLLGIRTDVALAREDQKNFLGKSGEGAHQVLDLALRLDLIHPADGGNYPLHGLGSFPTVLDDLEVMVLTRFFHSRKHGETSLISHLIFKRIELICQVLSTYSVAPHF